MLKIAFVLFLLLNIYSPTTYLPMRFHDVLGQNVVTAVSEYSNVTYSLTLKNFYHAAFVNRPL